MIIVLAIVLSLSIILYSQAKVIRNIGDSVISLSAADSGIEKVLYYDYQVVPDDGVATRGLCAICLSGLNTSPTCPTNDDDTVNCLSCESRIIDDNADGKHSDGCDPDVCNYCEVTFKTEYNDRSYQVWGDVFTSEDGLSTDFMIRSSGAYESAQRQIEILNTAAHPEDVIKIENACANPLSVGQNQTIEITADVTSLNSTIGSVTATIHDKDGNTVGIAILDLTGAVTWSAIWDSGSTTPNAYYVDIYAQDTSSVENPRRVIKKNIQPCL